MASYTANYNLRKDASTEKYDVAVVNQNLDEIDAQMHQNEVASTTPFTGASSSANGEKGIVPRPMAGDQEKYLRGDGTWAEVQGGGGGSSTLAGLSDVSVSSPTNGQLLKYNSSTQKWENVNDSSSPQTASGTFTTGANQYDKVKINCGFKPDYIQVLLPFSQSDTVATYDSEVSTTTSTWYIPQESRTYTLTLGESQGETGISDITDTGFKFRCNAGNTRNVACTYIASKAASSNSYSETTLFTGGTPSDTTFTLSDTITHYNTINVYYRHNDGNDDYIESKSYPASLLHSLAGTSVNVLGFCNDIWYYYFNVTDDTHFAYSKSNAGYISDIIGITS